MGKSIFKQVIQTARQVAVIVALGLCISPVAQAKTMDDLIKALNDFRTEVVGQTLRPFVTYYKNLIQTVETKWSTQASLANTTLAKTSVGDFIREQIDQKSLQKLGQALSQKDSANQIKVLAVLPASDTQSAKPAPPAGGGIFAAMKSKSQSQESSKDVNDNDRRLYADSLLGPKVYTTTDEKNNAEQTVSFLSDYFSPLGSIDPSTLTKDQLSKMNASPEGQRYRVHIRNLAAYRSLALSNYYSILMDRTPVKNLGKNAGLPDHNDPGKTDASPLEVEEYIATRRVDNADWYADMNKAPGIVIARETLFVLAEMEKNQFKIIQQNDRILATLTAMMVQGLNASKILPDKSESDLRQALGLEPTGPAADIANQVDQTRDEYNANQEDTSATGGSTEDSSKQATSKKEEKPKSEAEQKNDKLLKKIGAAPPS